ncbi:putative pectinesterase 67 [Zea mays]|uniref:Putative pectinesterase 67 n=1 Tax=Zea mays TaxID=4577 RepID=A0A1D6NP07_MAIZE|nr:putative pectinesterase 67 [Zea mays]
MARPRLLLTFLLAAAAVLTTVPGVALAKSKLAKKSDDVVNGPLLTEKIQAKKTLIVGPDEEFKTAAASSSSRARCTASGRCTWAASPRPTRASSSQTPTSPRPSTRPAGQP